MKKIGGIILFLLVFFSSFSTVFSYPKYSDENIVKAIVYFESSAVTTKNLKEKIFVPYTLKYATVKIKLDYIDDTLNEKIKNLSFTNIEQLERDYQILLRRFGMHEALEKIDQYGILLDSATIIIKQSDLDFLLDRGYRISLI